MSTVIAYDQATGAPLGIGTGIGASSSVQQLAYTWDGYGNLEERQDANQSNLYEKLTYDDLNRVSTSAVTNSANNGPTNDYVYDAMGNLTTPTISGTSETYTYDPSHPYAVDTVTSGSSTIYSASYDADGNMTTRNGYAITWTVDNLPESIASAAGSSTFSYGPEDQRYAQSATFNGSTTVTAYIGGLFEVVSTATDTEYRHSIIADGQVIAVHTIDQSGSAYTDYLHYDHLGSVDAITNDSGSVIQSMSFDAFGVRRDASNWDYDLSQNQIATLKNYTDRGYTDQEELDNLSLVDLNGRVYDPAVGRMISADPTVPDALYSQAFNRYSYVYNSPFQYVDPSGYDPDYTPDFCVGSAPCVTNSLPPISPVSPNDIVSVNNTASEAATTNITPAPTFIAGNFTEVPTSAATPVGTTGTAPVQPNWQTPINPVGPCQCNIGGDNQVGNIMNNTDGAQTCDENCFALIAQYASPTITDTRRNPDGPSRGGTDPGTSPGNATQNLPRRPGVGPIRPGTPMLGTLGLPIGYARIGRRPLDGIPFELNYLELRLIFAPAGPLVSLIVDYTIRPTDNLWHEQIFYNGGPNDQFNEGFFSKSGLFGPGVIQPDPGFPGNFSKYSFGPVRYLGPGISPSAFQNPASFSLYYNVLTHNCQDYCNLIMGPGGGH